MRRSILCQKNPSPFSLNSPPLLKTNLAPVRRFLSVPEAPFLFLILFSFDLFTFAQSFVEMLGVLWLTKRYLFSFRRRRSRLSMEQRRDSWRDDGEESRRLGLKGFVRSGFSLLDLWKFFLGDRSNHVAELNNPLPTTMLWIRLVVRAQHPWKCGLVVPFYRL